MTLHCLPTQTYYDVRCPVCGDGFLLLTEPTLRTHRMALQSWAAAVLTSQHDTASPRMRRVHPAEIFEIPDPDPASLVTVPAPWPHHASSR